MGERLPSIRVRRLLESGQERPLIRALRAVLG